MNNVISALTARTQLGQILKRATKNNERFVVDRRGEPSVVIMSIKDYVDTMAPAPQWLKDIQASSKRRSSNKLTMRQIDAEIAKVRRQRPSSIKQPITMIPRVVLDTNVVVSALLKPNGLEDQVLRLALAGRLLLCLSPEVLVEYARVLASPKFKFQPRRSRHGFTATGKSRQPGPP